MNIVRQIWVTNKCYSKTNMFENDFTLYLVEAGLALGLVRKDATEESGLKIYWLGVIDTAKFSDEAFQEIFNAGNDAKIQKFGISMITETYDEVLEIIKEYIKENKERIIRR